jgi:hypothetical protein
LVRVGADACGVCDGKHVVQQAAQMADAPSSHALLAKALTAADRATGGARRDALIHALVSWQIYGVAYVGVEHGLEYGTEEFTRVHAALRDRLVDAIRATTLP